MNSQPRNPPKAGEETAHRTWGEGPPRLRQVVGTGLAQAIFACSASLEGWRYPVQFEFQGKTFHPLTPELL